MGKLKDGKFKYRGGGGSSNFGSGRASDLVGGSPRGVSAKDLRARELRLEARETLEIDEVLESGNVKVMFNKKGKLKTKEVTPDELSRITGIPKNDILKRMDDVKVKDAVRLKGDDLRRLGVAGSLAAFVVFLMIVTGKSNPVEAISEALKAAAEQAADTGSDVFKSLFSGGLGGIFNVSALFLFCSSVILVVFLVGSVVLKK